MTYVKIKKATFQLPFLILFHFSLVIIHQSHIFLKSFVYLG